MEDSTSMFGMPVLNPQDAAENINESKKFNMTPSQYGAAKDEIKANRTIAQSTPGVMELMNTDDNYRVIAKDDIKKLGMFEKQTYFASSIIRGNDINRQISKRLQKEFSGEGINDQDAFDIYNLNAQVDALATEESFDYNFLESLPGYIVGSTVDWAKGLWENADIAASVAGTTTTVGLFSGGLPGAVAGAQIGAGLGIAAAGFNDSWENSRGIVLNEMDNAELDLPKERKVRIANGAGLTIAALDLVGDFTVAKTVPWLSKRLTPKAFTKQILRAENKPWLAMAERIGTAGLGEGGTEGAQELAQIFAVELGKTWNGKETSFFTAMENSVTKFENLKRIGKAAAIGAVAGPVIGETLTAGGKVVNAATNKMLAKTITPKIVESGEIVSNIDETPVTPVKPTGQAEEAIPKDTQLGFKDPDIQKSYASRLTPEGQLEIQRGVKAIQVAQTIVNTIGQTYETNTKNLIPEDMMEFRQKIMAKAGLPYIVLDAEKTQEWANTDEKAEKLRDMVDKTGTAARQMGADFRIEAGRFTSLVEDFGESALHLMKLEEGDKSLDEYLNMFKSEKTKADELLQGITSPNGDLMSWKAKHVLEDTTETDVTDKYNPQTVAEKEQAYIDQPNLDTLVKGGFTDNEAQRFSKAMRDARQQIVGSVRESMEIEADRVRDVAEGIALEVEREAQVERIANDPRINIVESFINDKPLVPFLDPSQIKRNHKKKNSPLLAINPESLTPEQRRVFLDDPVLATRKTFDKGGIPLRDAAERLNVKPGELLEILRTTPDRKTALRNAMELRANDVIKQARESVDLNEVNAIKYYDNVSKVYQDTMKLLASRNYSNFALGVKRAAAITSTGDARMYAESLVKDIPVNQLNLKGYKVAEAKANKKALDAYLKGDFESVIEFKQQAQMNNEMQRAVAKAIANTNRTTKKIGRLMSKNSQLTIAEAGTKFVNAWNELAGAFNLDPAAKQSIKSGAYERYLKKMQTEGLPGQVIDEDLKVWLEGATSPQDLTVDQYINLGNKLAAIHQQAKNVNKQINEIAEAIDIRTTDEMVDLMVAELEGHIDYNPANAVNPQTGLTTRQKLTSLMNNWDSFSTNIEFIGFELSEGKIADNMINQNIIDPLKGRGRFSNSRNGAAAASKLLNAVTSRYEDLVKAYGPDDYKNWNVDLRQVRAFEKIPSLNNGRVTKADLIMMALNMGNDYNRAKIGNFGIDPNTVFEVLKFHLGKKDWDFVQGVWNIYADLAPRVKEVHKTLTGEDLEMVTPTPFTLELKSGGTVEYQGGYFPAKYRKDTSAEDSVEKLKRSEDVALGREPEYIPDVAAEGIVKSPHTKQRTGSDWELNLDFSVISNSLEDVIYSTTMAIPVRDVTKLLQNERLGTAIASVVGRNKLNILIETVKEATKSPYADMGRVFNEQNRKIQTAVKSVQSALAVTYIAYRLSSTFIQLTSMRNVMIKMGPAAPKYLSIAAGRFAQAITTGKVKELYDFAAEIDPSIETTRLNVDLNAVSKLKDMSLKKRTNYSKSWNLLLHLKNGVSRFAFDGILGKVDVFQKVVTALAAYNQYTSGNAPGGKTIQELSTMSEDDRFSAAKSYASSIITSGLTAGSPEDRNFLQKSPILIPFAQYANDARNTLNTNIQEARNVKYNLKKSLKYIKEGNTEKAALNLMDAGGRMINLTIISAIALAYQDMIKGALLGGEEDDTPEEQIAKFGIRMAADMTIDQAILLRDISYAFKIALATEKTPTVATPITRAMTDVAVTAKALSDMYQAEELELALQTVSEKDLKSIFSTTSVMLGGIPVNAGFDIYKFMQDRENGAEPPMVMNVLMAPEAIVQSADNILETIRADREAKTEEEEFQELLKEYKEGTTSPEMELEKLKQNAQVGPMRDATPKILSPEAVTEFKDIVKWIESRGVWNARPLKKNGEPLSSAFGYYQFVKKTWEDIRVLAPHLNLTEEGRTSKDTTQQERAMEWLAQHNAESLKKADIDLSPESLYSAHYLGSGNTIKILGNKYDSKKLESVLSEQAIAANPWLIGKSIGWYKRWLKDKIDKGRINSGRQLNPGDIIDYEENRLEQTIDNEDLLP